MKSSLTFLFAALSTIAFADHGSNPDAKLAVIPASAKPIAYIQTSDGLAMKTSAFHDVPSINNVTMDEMQSILDTHNEYRRMHGSPALTWNDAAASWGDNWLQNCEFKHSNGGPYSVCGLLYQLMLVFLM